jgi:hypothetical protein
MRHRLPIRLLGLVLAVAAPLAAAQQVYKWTDDKGVVNYSNTPPDKTKKGVSVVEDRVSVYSSDPAVIQATQNARARSGLTPPPAAPDRPVAAVIGPSGAPGPPVSAVDPCLNGYDPAACGHYDGVPVFAGRRRPPHLVQPNLPPGAIAGNVNQNSGFTPGLSTQADLGAPPPVVRRQVPQTARGRDLPTR